MDSKDHPGSACPWETSLSILDFLRRVGKKVKFVVCKLVEPRMYLVSSKTLKGNGADDQ